MTASRRAPPGGRPAGARGGHHQRDLVSHRRSVAKTASDPPTSSTAGSGEVDDRAPLPLGQPMVQRQEGHAVGPELMHEPHPCGPGRHVDDDQLASRQAERTVHEPEATGPARDQVVTMKSTDAISR